MAVEYQHDLGKFAYAGLDLNVPVDLVPPTKYSRATNVVSKIEGRMESRDGTVRIAHIVDATPIHTIFRLTQSVKTIVGERLVGAGSVLYTAPLPAGSVFSALAGGPAFDGGPLSILQFRFDADPGGVWAIIANSAGMMKRRAGYYQVLGVVPPTVQSTASAGGVGLLDSSLGTGYDWRYTYLNEVTLSESNGSPITATVDLLRPTSQINPDPSFGGAPFVNPTLAYDNNFATSASISISGALASIRFVGWAAAPHQYSALQLNVNLDFAGSLPESGGTVEYSIDGGVNWNPLFQASNVTIGVKTYTANLNVGQDLTKLQVRVHCSAINSVQMRIYEVWLNGVINPVIPLTTAVVNQSANVCVTPPVDPQETAIRLYRRGGTLPDNWFQVGQYSVSSLVQGSCGAGTLLINDNIPDSTVEVNPILPQDNFPPIQSVQATNFPLPVIFGPYDERVLGCGDPARPESVYFSNRGNADLWGAEDWVVVADPGEQMMNGIVYALRCFGFSREALYILLPNIIAGVTFTPSKTSCQRGLKGRWAMCKGEQGIYFVSKDGLYRTQGGPEQSVIDDSIRPLFPVREGTTGHPANGYDAVDLSDEDHLRLTFHNSEIWFFYTGLTTQQPQLLIYDERRSRWRGADYPDNQVIAYSEPNTSSSLLFGATDGDLYGVGGAVDGETQADVAVEFRTGAFDQGRPLNLKEYVNVFIDIDPGGATLAKPVTLTPIVNGGAVTEAALFITGSGRQRVPLPLNQAGTEVYAYNLEFDFAWAANGSIQPIAYQYDIEYRHEPAEMTHWELPQSGMGLEGWFHIRDIYIVLRSNAPVTFTVTPGTGSSQTFTLPSTGGAKNTIYVQLGPSKANSYAFAIDSAAPFRLYADEIEVRAKQWLTKLGYKNIPIIGREQVGRPFGLTNV